MLFMTFTFSSRISSAEVVTGFSIAMIVRTCNPALPTSAVHIITFGTASPSTKTLLLTVRPLTQPDAIFQQQSQHHPEFTLYATATSQIRPTRSAQKRFGGGTTHLHEMVLQNVPHNSKRVEVTATTASAKVLLEGDLHTFDVVSVPQRAQKTVGEPRSEKSYEPLPVSMLAFAATNRNTTHRRTIKFCTISFPR
jgi:hypothetical protein